ncbi:hypothetical protein FALBO_486 [Fusarium albosuccineum]|uniref:Metalloendopeptidase n=1 Tax=Fusarium albosuccineum TaxID=1237068 RepID=A0A8H4LN07_9HYPO|nr:hypothetical protein FALBO_486 [Fusarium albosuccineum]
MSSTTVPGIISHDLLWPADKTCIKVRFMNGEPWQRGTVQLCVWEHYHAVPMRIRFQFLKPYDTSGLSDIRVWFGEESRSLVGRDAEKHLGQQTMELNLDVPKHYTERQSRMARQHTILHEFGHALGMFHQHLHPDFLVDWDFARLEKKSGWSAAILRDRYQPLENGREKLGPYDSLSIMHYPVGEGDTLNSVPPIGLNLVLSEGDKRYLTLAYPKPERASSKTPKEKPSSNIAITSGGTAQARRGGSEDATGSVAIHHKEDIYIEVLGFLGRG